MKYEAVIGLEVHAELSTKSKIYCSCSTGFGAPINTHTCPVCTGMPGALPVLNKQVVHYAAKMGKATGCTINQLCKADRKNYFYPDLPKAYQISQFDVPICENGEVFFYVDGVKHSCRLERIHFEEDAGKLLHDEIDGTIVDFNRCGVPLIEMVTRPDLHSSAEAKEFLEMIKTTLSYLDICDCKMEEGSIRCDVNVSIRPEGSTELGTRVEMKNINTFSGAVRAIDYEIARQIEVVENGGEIQQETRRWDDVKLKNTVMRTKEDAQDYRYFPDPDLIAVEISDEWLHQIESEVPELPITRYERYLNEYGMTAMEARLLSDSFEKAELLDAAAKQAGESRYSDAVETLQNADDILSGDNDIAAKIEEYRALYPVSLTDLSPSGGEDCSQNWTAYDANGNAYSNGLNFSLYPVIAKTVYTEYAPNGQYKRLTGTWVVEGDTSDDFIGTVRIYVDDHLQYEVSSLTVNSPASALSLSISGASTVRIEVEGAFASLRAVGYLYLADAKFEN